MIVRCMFMCFDKHLIITNMNSPNSLKVLPSVYLYNMLQDFRHLLVFDFRNGFQQIHIRDAFHVHPGLNREQIIEVIEMADRKASEKEDKYKNLQKVRRYFFVDEQKVDANHDGVKFVMSCLGEKIQKQDKYYGLGDSFEQFSKTYPWVVLDSNKIQQASEKGQAEHDKALLYPYAKFPSQIIPGKLYLSSVACSNSQRMLDDLGILSLIDFIDYNEEQKIPDFKSSHASYHCIPINREVPVVLDFDQINKLIDEQVSKGKVLLYCKDGQSVSPAFAVGYLMYKAKLNVQMATLKVCQAISRVELDKMVYGQLLVYKPKQ